MKACCFTGYRPEKMPFPFDEKNREYVRFENTLLSCIAEAINDGYDTFYCGGARGFDLLAAELLVLLRHKFPIRIITVVPHRSQAEKYKAPWAEIYKKMLDASDEVVCLSEQYHASCFEVRNRYMVDRSERVIAFWDGQGGGTRNTVAYAKSRGTTVVNIADMLTDQYSIF